MYEETCEKCRFESRKENELPCKICKNNYTNKFSPKIKNIDKFIIVFGESPSKAFKNFEEWENEIYEEDDE